MTIHMEIRTKRKSPQKITAIAKKTNQNIQQDTTITMHQKPPSQRQDLTTNTIGSAHDLQPNLILHTIEDMN